MVSKLQLICLVLTISLSIVGCYKETPILETDNSTLVQQTKKSATSKVLQTVVDDKQYNSSISDPFTFTSLTIEDEIIMMTGTFSGGCGSSEILFMARSKVSYSSGTPSIKAKFVLIDQDPCQKQVSKSVQFDLTSLKVQGYNALDIYIEDYGKVTYNY